MFAKSIAASLVPALVAGAILVTTAPRAETTQVAIGPVSVCNSIDSSPVLIYNFAGGTLTGTLHTQFAVYTNGLATISRVNNLVFPTGTDDVDAALTYVDPTLVKNLAKQLVKRGAFKLCDQSLAVADIPLTTITVINEGPTTRAHSFSYWVGSDEYAEVHALVQDFINTTFPGF